MKKGTILEGIVEKTAFPNKGIVTIEDQEITVKDALEGQKIQFCISKKKKGRIEGRLLQVLRPAPAELPKPPCEHFGSCGGCTWQNLPGEAQRRLKKKQVEDLIRQSGLDINIEEILESPIETGYRNKMEFTFGDAYKDGPLALGMHKKGSFYDIVTLKNCRIIDSDIQKILDAVLDYFTREETSYYHRIRHQGFLRHLVVRRSAKTGHLLINLVTTSQGRLQADEFVRTLTDLMQPRNAAGSKEGNHRSIDGKIVGILHTINDAVADTVQSDETRLLYGQDYLYEYLFNLKFKISPFSFFQTNTLGAELLYDKVREYAGDTRDKIIYDLYSGTGTIAQILAPVARQVTGVEIVREAVEAARENAALNRLANCAFIAGDVQEVVDSLTQKPDLIILDPPRDGIHPKALRKIIGFGVPEIIYVSCKPTSLMRDLLLLKEAGYQAERCCLCDMFPGTVHIETVVLLSKGEIDSKKVRVEFSLEDMDMSGFQKGATYGEIKAYVKEKTGLQVSSLYIAQVKQKCGIIERENYNKPKSENAKQPQCPPEKEEAIRAALKHFQMI